MSIFSDLSPRELLEQGAGLPIDLPPVVQDAQELYGLAQSIRKDPRAFIVQEVQDRLGVDLESLPDRLGTIATEAAGRVLDRIDWLL